MRLDHLFSTTGPPQESASHHLRLDLLFSTTGPPQESASHHFARVTFQFSARVLAARTVSADIEAVSGRTFQKLVATRAVLAGVAEKPLKNRLEDLNLLDAVGPSFFDNRPATGECFAPQESASHHLKALTPDLRLDPLFSATGPRRRVLRTTFGRFRKNHFSTKILHFARVTFQFSARELNIRKPFRDIEAFSDRTFPELVEVRAVLAAVAEKPLKNRFKDLNVPLAVGPSFFDNRPATGECFAPTCSSGCSSGFRSA